MTEQHIHREFLTLAVEGSGTEEILHTLSRFTGGESAFTDTWFESIRCCPEEGTLARLLQSGEPVPEGRFGRYQVANRERSFGWLLYEKTRPAEEVQPALEYAAVALILHCQTRIANRQMAEKYKEVFLEDLLLSNVKADIEIHSRARLYGWDFSQGGLAAVVDINNIKKYFVDTLDEGTNQMLEQATETIFNLSISEMRSAFPESKYLRQSDLIVFLISAGAKERTKLAPLLEETFLRLRERLAAESRFTVTLGVGQYYENIRDIAKSYAEARTAINLGYSLQWFDRILFYNRLGLYRLLAPMADRPEARELTERCISPLTDYDRKHNSELLPTLQAVIQQGWNLKAAAEGLYVHYNSVKYRYAKICRLLDMDLNLHDNRTLVEVALKLHLLRTPPANRE